ncbi:MAG: IclR family transcriptional regulator [Burkholderiaceae bacterium]
MPEISKTADQALTVLEYVAEHGPIGTSDLARRLKMHRTVAHRLLATLQGRGFVRRVSDGYLPGVALLKVAQFVEPELLAAARPVLETLARTHGETFILTVPNDDEAIQIEQSVGSHHFVRVQLARGFRHPLSKGASGRSILAFMPNEVIERTVASDDEPERLRQQLADALRDGYAVSRDELSPGVHGVSVPIMIDGLPAASLGVVFPAVRADSLPAYAKILRKAAVSIVQGLHRSSADD